MGNNSSTPIVTFYPNDRVLYTDYGLRLTGIIKRCCHNSNNYIFFQDNGVYDRLVHGSSLQLISRNFHQLNPPPYCETVSIVHSFESNTSNNIESAPPSYEMIYKVVLEEHVTDD